MADYRLSAELHGHDSDVRCCCVVSKDMVVTGSRDKNLIIWGREVTDGKEGTSFAPIRTLIGHQNFVNSVCSVDGGSHIASGSADKTIRIWNLETGKCVGVLAGHSASVCSLKSGASSAELLSCSWDNTARVWALSGDEQSVDSRLTLVGHEASVWDTIYLDGKVVTASADKTIKVWNHDDGSLISTLSNAHTDVVRSLVAMPNGGFASVSNDGSMRIWTPSDSSFTCTQSISALHDDQFIYSCSSYTSDGGPIIASAGEDNTVKVVQASPTSMQFEQSASVPHPGTVWEVSFLPNGDVLSGCSDSVGRIFTVDAARVGDAGLIKQYEDVLAQRQVSTKVIGGVDVDTLRDAETALLEPGKKDGENLIVRRGNIAEVYMWQAGAAKWTKVGDVVDGPGDDSAQTGGGGGVIDGRSYDFVFDVELDEGGGNRKCGYNRGENPYEAAQRFIDANELNQEFLDQIAQFIEQNVSKDNRLVGGNAVASDPFTGRNRYVPGAVNNTPTPAVGNASSFTPNRYIPGGSQNDAPPATTALLPLEKLVLFTTTDQAKKIVEKLKENNAESAKDGVSLDESELAHLTDNTAKMLFSKEVDGFSDVDVSVLRNALKWRTELLVPVLDLARLAVAEPKLSKFLLEGDANFMLAVEAAIENPAATAPVLILASRFFCNMFSTSTGTELIKSSMDRIVEKTRAVCAGSSNTRVRETYASLLANFSIATKGTPKAHLAMESAINLVRGGEKEEKVLFWSMMAVGTCMSASKEETQKGQDLGVAEAATTAASSSARLMQLANEIAQLLVQ